MGRIGVLGGTFDPIHYGHLWLGEAAREQLNLDQVLFLPAGQPPHKPDTWITSADHRLAMAELAMGGNPHFAIHDLDARRPPPHYTATLMPLLRQAYPGADLWLVIGSDSLADLPNWHRPESVIEQCRLAVLPRPSITVNWVTLSQAVPGVDAAVDMLDGPTIDLSGSRIRRWAAAGRSLQYLVPDKVLDYIRQEKLYSPARA
jgi:nicotinate-nucleotide adenylyltransferase